MRIFIGGDSRQPLAFNVLAHSIYARASIPVSITKLNIDTLPIKRRGLTEFTFSRYLVPWLCNYEGTALFMDADMLCLCDINELNFIPGYPIAVVKNNERFEWPSLMLFNNALCKTLTPEFIETENPQKLNTWANDILELLPEYNHIVPYSGKNPNAKIVHFTQGIPCFDETKDCEFSKEWQEEHRRMNSTVSWHDIMGTSIHAQRMGIA